jgi:hypothetical protein
MKMARPTSGYKGHRLPNGGAIFWGGGRRARGYALGMYTPGSWLGVAYKKYCAFAPAAAVTAEVQDSIEASRIPVAGLLAGYVSPPGHWQKVVSLHDVNGSIAVLKTAVAPGAAGRVAQEKKILSFLQRQPRLRIYAPGLLESLGDANLRPDQVAIAYAMDCRNDRRKLPEMAHEAMAALRDSTLSPGQEISETEFFREASAFTATVSTAPDWRELLKSALDELCGHSQAKVRTVLAHRDFGAWNVVQTSPSSVKILDWEYAAFGRMPGHDWLCAALLGVIARHRDPNRCAAAFLATRSVQKASRIDLLAFLIDTAVQYLGYFFEGGDAQEGKLLVTAKVALRKTLEASR